MEKSTPKKTHRYISQIEIKPLEFKKIMNIIPMQAKAATAVWNFFLQLNIRVKAMGRLARQPKVVAQLKERKNNL